MAHEIHHDANGKAAFAYVGQAAWHGLGQQLTPDAPIPMWITEAGFDWEIKEAKVMGACDFNENGTSSLIEMPDRKMLYRSDTHAPLAVVGNKYNVVQPPDVIRFYEDLVEQGGFNLETAGVLFGGRRMFALAKVNEGVSVYKNGKDLVKQYLLLSTACDGTMATQVRNTSVRVVCNNTLQMSFSDGLPLLRIPHSARFNPETVKQQLGLTKGSFDLFMDQARALASRKLTDTEAIRFLVNLVGDPTLPLEDQAVGSANKMKGIYTLYRGAAKGAELAGNSAWGMLNSVTEFVDHHMSFQTADNQLNNALFGDGVALKQQAMQDLLAHV